MPLVIMAALTMQAQPDLQVIKPSGQLSIPAELTKTIRADKVHRGDPVEFITVEAVLIAPKLVMPPHTKLFGRVVGAAPQQAGKPSWLVLLVERAEWKQYSVPLHAFISSQIALVRGTSPSDVPADNSAAASSSRRTARMSGRVAAQSDSELSTLSKPPQDASDVPKDGAAMAKGVALKDIRIVRDKDGTSYLFSAKSNVKLPGGTLFMLQHQASTLPGESVAGGPP
jgi:hypothetical protein